MNGRFFYAAGIAFASGIFTRSFYDLSVPELLLILCTAVALIFAAMIRGTFVGPLLVTGVVLSAFMIGALRLDIVESKVSELSAFDGEVVAVHGKVAREPEMRDRFVHLYVRPETLDELVLVTIDRFTEHEFAYGDFIVATGIMRRPDAFETDSGRIFDYPGFLKAHGVHMILPFAQAETLSRDKSMVGKLYALKGQFLKSIERSIPEPAAGLGEGILLGVKRAIGESLEDAFRDTGIIHIVVLSGYNIMIVVAGTMHLLSFLFYPRTRLIMGIIAIILFAILVGLSATVVRASIMAGLLLIAHATGRTYAVLRALIFAAVVMLLLNPYLLIHDPGFQLSFLATLGLILLSPHLDKRLSTVPPWFGVRGFVVATVATQLFVLPMLLYQTGSLSLVSIFVNVLVLPMVPIAMLLTFITGTVTLVSIELGMALGFLANVSLQYIVLVAESFARFPLASVSVDTFPFWVVVVSYAGMALVLIRMRAMERREEVKNDYSDWTIVEEKENFPLAQGASGKSALPFS